MVNIVTLFDEVIDPARRLGVFDKVNGHEPKSAPASGITCSYFLDFFGPIPARSGLDRTSVLCVFQARVQMSMLYEPQDGIDPALLAATSKLLEIYSGDFETSTGQLDLLGAFWPSGLAARAAYVDQGNKKYRAMIVSIPIVINDAYGQVQ